jgi:lipopolysaccharide/colanic/teichoic acid biosynthesis glycosyltransferase
VRHLTRLLTAIGVVVVVFGFGKLHARAHGYDLSASFRLPWSVAYVGALLVALYSVGLPDARPARREAWAGAVTAVVAAAGSLSLAQLALGSAVLPRAVIFGSAFAIVPWAVTCARLTSDQAARPERDRVLLIADHSDQVLLDDELDEAPERRAHVVGFLPVEQAAGDAHAAPAIALAERTQPSVVVLSRRAQDEESIVAQVAVLHERGTRVRSLSGFYEEWLGKLPLSELERTSLFFDIRELHRAQYGRVKRVADIAVGLLGLVPLAVALPLVAVGNRFGNRGPLFYAQDRVGKGGRRIRIVKFRTMVPGAPASRWTSVDDPRVTRFGRFLRRTHIDELPQVLGIVRGELSLVGPRPEQPAYVAELSDKLPFYDLRHLVRPGLTGWAQVKYGYAGDERGALEKLQYEFFYLRHQSPRLDLRIVARTLRSVLGGMGSGR